MNVEKTTAITNVKTRYRVIQGCKRIVIKVGSRLLTEIKSTSKQRRIEELIEQCDQIRRKNYDVILVTSGSISTGMELTNTKKRPRNLSQLQALAAIGQGRLMSLYENSCKKLGFHCGQILLSYDDLKSRKRHLHLCNCLNTLLSQKVLPIINENDAISVDEISFGDNDKLAALLSAMTHAELTILLTTVEGFLHQKEGTGERISVVKKISKKIKEIAKGTDGNQLSIGGMSSKIEAAEICMAAGESLWIADGREFSILSKILNAEDVGTLFYPTSNRLTQSKKRWLAFFTDPLGDVSVDDGAKLAIASQGRSLLPIGVIGLSGDFENGDTVNIKDKFGKLIGMGITNFSNSDLRKTKGLRTNQILDRLGSCNYDEVIHRDNLVII